MFRIIEGKGGGLCKAYRCTSAKCGTDKFCSKHRKRVLRETNPTSYFYNLLKSNARRRKKEFTLTLEQFADFCQRTDYLALKGKKGKSASIDRIRPNEGYHAGNIQVLTLSENSKKLHQDKKDCPF